eukprot:CAMPEP_0196193492 /NCGR_PEP_ID=MMETSP0911-20130528/49568_1 /TAXON_ID=49265 /ORGANISM="Thalassiosira rotula, Strain GSO102" /LENGTH=174 /DNA_ID=CAMNT_0041465731 /DNA_START=359 /DNA_END=883 /DNA_ORIENTATION=-
METILSVGYGVGRGVGLSVDGGHAKYLQSFSGSLPTKLPSVHRIISSVHPSPLWSFSNGGGGGASCPKDELIDAAIDSMGFFGFSITCGHSRKLQLLCGFLPTYFPVSGHSSISFLHLGNFGFKATVGLFVSFGVGRSVTKSFLASSIMDDIDDANESLAPGDSSCGASTTSGH